MTTMVGDALAVPPCWELLRSAKVGRLAVWLEGRPEILPVNHIVDRGSLVFRTAAGSSLARSAHGGDVAFEVDGYDEESGEAWSVVVKGSTRLIRNLHELVESVQLPVRPWHSGPKHVLVRLEPVEVTGRRFRISDALTWSTEVDGVSRHGDE